MLGLVCLALFSAAYVKKYRCPADYRYAYNWGLECCKYSREDSDGTDAHCDRGAINYESACCLEGKSNPCPTAENMRCHDYSKCTLQIISTPGISLNWESANRLALEKGCVLPEKDDFQDCGLPQYLTRDTWVPVRRSDGREGDFCQVGNRGDIEKYGHYSDDGGDGNWGIPSWRAENKTSVDWRPHFFYCVLLTPVSQVNFPRNGTWHEAVAEAKSHGARLAWLDEIQNAGYQVADGRDLWAPVIRNDKKCNDYVQLGNPHDSASECPVARYDSRVDTCGYPLREDQRTDYIYQRTAEPPIRIYIDPNATWTERREEAHRSGCRLISFAEIVHYDISVEAAPSWIPYQRRDLRTDDWCLIGPDDTLPKFTSYLDKFHNIPESTDTRTKIDHFYCIQCPGIQRISISNSITWQQAKREAESRYGRLPTCRDLEECGVQADEPLEFWIPVYGSDGREGVYCQLGYYEGAKVYEEHPSDDGVPPWGNEEVAFGFKPPWFYMIVGCSQLLSTNEDRRTYSSASSDTTSSMLGDLQRHWKPSNDTRAYIELNLGRSTRVYGVGAQGCVDGSGVDTGEYVTEFEVLLSHDSSSWRKEAGHFASGRGKEVRRAMFDRPTLAHFVRLIVKRWNIRICMHADVIACTESCPSCSEWDGISCVDDCSAHKNSDSCLRSQIPKCYWRYGFCIEERPSNEGERHEYSTRTENCADDHRCNACEGDCDNNVQCEGPLVCYRRIKPSDRGPPECNGTREDSVSYCGAPQYADT